MVNGETEKQKDGKNLINITYQMKATRIAFNDLAEVFISKVVVESVQHRVGIFTRLLELREKSESY